MWAWFLAYAVAAFSQGIATWALPATGHGIGLGVAIMLFVAASTIVTAVIVLREPRDLPGREMA